MALNTNDSKRPQIAHNRSVGLLIVCVIAVAISLRYGRSKRESFRLEGTASLKLLRTNELVLRDTYIFAVERAGKRWRILVRSISGDEVWDEEVVTEDGRTLEHTGFQWANWAEKRRATPPRTTKSIHFGPLISPSCQIITKCIFLQWVVSPDELRKETNYFPLTKIQTANGAPWMTIEQTNSILARLTGLAPGFIRKGEDFENYPDGYLVWRIQAGTNYVNRGGVKVPTSSVYEKFSPKGVAATGHEEVRRIWRADMIVTNIMPKAF